MGATGIPGAGFGYNPQGGGWDRVQGVVLIIFSSELLLFSSMGVQGLEMSTMWTSVYLTTALQHILYTQLIHPG